MPANPIARICGHAQYQLRVSEPYHDEAWRRFR
jgi:hypothetical protein